MEKNFFVLTSNRRNQFKEHALALNINKVYLNFIKEVAKFILGDWISPY